MSLIANQTRRGKSMETEKDCINELPDDILSSIVSYFSVRDAAKASLVSSRWRRLCAASMSQLDFDSWSMFGKKCNRCSVGEVGAFQEYKDIFVRGVNQFIQYYKGTRLVFLRIVFCLESDSTYDIDHWVRFASSMGVEDLHLNFLCNKCFLDGRPCRDRNFYVLRSELLSQNRVPKLQHVFLRSCILGPGVINQFSCLKSLMLGDIVLSQHEVELIHSCCLNLESMMLDHCYLPLKLCISGSLHQLKHFSIYGCWKVEELEIFATNLISFNYGGIGIKLSFAQVPKLEKVFFRAFDRNGMHYVFSQLAKDLPLVKTLSISSAMNWIECLPEHIATFNKVKKFGFYSNTRVNLDIFKIITILKACPLMEKLELMILSEFAEKETSGLLLVPPKSDYKHLKEVHIRGFLARPCFFEFTTYMLEYAAAVERIIIDPQAKFYNGVDFWTANDRVTWDKGEREEVCLRLQDHPKSSLLIIL